jgi:hypothetical protein
MPRAAGGRVLRLPDGDNFIPGPARVARLATPAQRKR